MGRALTNAIVSRGDEVVILTRSPSNQSRERVREIQWNAKTVGSWMNELDGAHAIVNLVGRTVDCRKTPANKKVILESRVNSVTALAEALKQIQNPPPIWVQTGTAHIFGDSDFKTFTDGSETGEGFAPDVGRAWEAAFDAVDAPNLRKVNLRISFVLGRDGGAMRKLSTLARFGLGGTVGSGRQWISWIHLIDMVRIFLRAIDNESMHGTYVITAPNPVDNKTFMRELRRAVHRPWSPRVPAPIVKIGARLMNTDPELALLGRRIVPKRIIEEGFDFKFPTLAEALDDLQVGL